jgi:hypothetical protein
VVAAEVNRMGPHYWLYMLTAIFVRPRKVGFPERIHRANGLSPSASAGPGCGGQDQQEGPAGEPGDERLGDAEGPELRVLASGCTGDALPTLITFLL